MSAGYSGTPLPGKLGIKPDSRVALLHAPSGFADQLALADGEAAIHLSLRGRVPLDVIVLFAAERMVLSRDFARAAARLAKNGGLWIAWPKKASGVTTDLTEDIVRADGLALGLVDNKVCAIDAVWSGLRFVVRLKDR